METGNSSSMQSSSGGGDEQEYESSTSGATAGNYLLSNNSNFAQYMSPSGTMSPFMFPSSAVLPSTQHHQNNAASYQLLQSSLFGVVGSETNYQDNLNFWQQHQTDHEPAGGSSNYNPLTQMAGSSSCTPNLIVSGTNIPRPQLSPGDFGRVSSSSASASAAATDSATKYGSSTGTTSTSTGVVGAGTSTTVSTGAGTSSGGSNKNPRKRTRASRRAPTTVLTTDTSNFRTMVQEFTGIPSSPFSAAASPLLSRRLNDLFAAGGGGAFGAGSTSLERFLAAGGGAGGVGAYNYPFRPAALKPAHPSGSPSSSTTNPSMNVPSGNSMLSMMNTDPLVAAGFLPSSSPAPSSSSLSLSSSTLPLRYPLTGATDLQQGGQVAQQQVAGLQMMSSTGATQFHHQQQHVLRGIMNPNEQMMSFMSTADRNLGGAGALPQAVRLPQSSDGRSGWISREVTGSNSKSTENDGIDDSGNIRGGSASIRE